MGSCHPGRSARRYAQLGAALLAAGCLPTLGGCLSINLSSQPIGPAVYTRTIHVGFYADCLSVGFGVERCDKFVFDPRTCGIGIVTFNGTPSQGEKAMLQRLSTQVQAECLGDKP